MPIVEPDVSMSGTHTLEAAVAINTKIQSVLYRAMLEHGVFMEGCILKSNIVNPGKKCPVPYTVDEIAQVGGPPRREGEGQGGRGQELPARRGVATQGALELTASPPAEPQKTCPDIPHSPLPWSPHASPLLH